MGCPDVPVESGPRCVAGGTNALKAGVVSALVNCSALGDGTLEASGIGAENDFGSSVDMAVGEQSTWA